MLSRRGEGRSPICCGSSSMRLPILICPTTSNIPVRYGRLVTPKNPVPNASAFMVGAEAPHQPPSPRPQWAGQRLRIPPGTGSWPKAPKARRSWPCQHHAPEPVIAEPGVGRAPEAERTTEVACAGIEPGTAPQHAELALADG